MKKRTLKSRILALVTCTLVLIGALIIPIGAESSTEATVAETPAYTCPIDWSAYPGANLTTAKKVYKNADKYAEMVVDGRNCIRITSAKTIKNIPIEFKENTQYTVSFWTKTENFGGATTGNAVFTFFYTDGSNSSIYGGIKSTEWEFKTLTSTLGKTVKAIGITAYQYQIYNYIDIDTLMLNISDVAYPYMPYLPYYLEQAFKDGYSGGYENGYNAGKQDGVTEGYENGYTDGETTGYENGYTQGKEDGTTEGYENGFVAGQESIDQDAIRQEGYEAGYDQGSEDFANLYKNASLNIFRAASIELKTHYMSNDGQATGYRLTNVPFLVDSNNVLNFSDISDYALNYIQNLNPSANENNVYIDAIYFTWPKAKDYEGAFSLSKLDEILYNNSNYSWATISSSLITGYVEGTAKSFYGRTSHNAHDNTLTFPDITENFTAHSLSLSFTDPDSTLISNMRSFSISTDIQLLSDVYKEGYVNGYFDGTNAEFSDIKKESYQEGYGEGYLWGKKEGIEISKTGDWRNLITAVVEIPSTMFMNMFNFEILGLDMRMAFGSIISICILLIIIKYAIKLL